MSVQGVGGGDGITTVGMRALGVCVKGRCHEEEGAMRKRVHSALMMAMVVREVVMMLTGMVVDVLCVGICVCLADS